MKEESNGLIQASMRYGTLLGALWIIAFAVYIAALTTPSLSPLFLILLAASPIVAGCMGIKYRKQEKGNRLGFLEAWSFMTISYLCASVLSAIACYIYFRFMDNGALLTSFKEQIDIFTAAAIDEELKKAFTGTYDLLTKMNASDYCMQYFTTNIFITTFLAPITSIFVYKNR